MNPYERRGLRRGDEVGLEWQSFIGTGRVEHESPLAMEDLEALVESAGNRALRRQRGLVSMLSVKPLQNARREAWDQGHAIGAEEERHRLLRAMDAQFGDKVRALIEDGHTDGEQSTPEIELRNLRGYRAAVLGVLEELILAHHREFRA